MQEETKIDIKFSEIKEPRLLCLIAYSGGGTKLFQSYLDGHPEIYNIPVYPLLYFYPHWETWQEQYQEVWNWDTIINIFCIKHASVIDSRNIIGINGLEKLGEDKTEHISIDGEEFRLLLKQLLREEPVRRRTFLLAVNYAYALCKGEDITSKKILLWHHHVVDYLDVFLSDFPDATILATIRDPRIKIYKIYDQWKKVDQIKLNPTDAMIHRSNLFYQANKYMFLTPYRLKRLTNARNVLFLKHEDMAADLLTLMRKSSDFLGIKFLDLMLESTLDGKVWWVPEVYEGSQMNKAGPAKGHVKQISQEVLNKVLSKDWKQHKSPLEIFVFEGMIFSFLKKYGYEPFYYTNDSLLQRMMWTIAVLFPYQIEIQDTLFYWNPMTHLKVITTAWKEARGDIKRKYYGFNATYLYKYTYKHLRLWQRPMIVCWLDCAEKNKDMDVASRQVFMAARILYVLYVYMRFLVAIIYLPVQYIRRLTIYYVTFFKRICHGDFLAPLF